MKNGIGEQSRQIFAWVKPMNRLYRAQRRSISRLRRGSTMRLYSRLCCKCDSWVRLSCSPREHVWLLFRMKARTSQDSQVWEVVQGTVEFSYFRFGQNIRWYAGSSSKKSWLSQIWVTEIKFDELLIDAQPNIKRNEMWINYWNNEQQKVFFKALYSNEEINFNKLG